MLSDADHIRLICLIHIEQCGDVPDGCDGFNLSGTGFITEADGRWTLTEVGAQFLAEHGVDELMEKWGSL